MTVIRCFCAYTCVVWVQMLFTIERRNFMCTTNRTPARPKPQIPVLWDRECRNEPIVLTTISGIQKMSSTRSYGVTLYESCDDLLSQAGNEKHVIVVGFESASMQPILQTLSAAGKRIVLTGMDTDHIDAHYSCATFSRRLSTEQLLDHLLEKGCRHIALVGVGRHSSNDSVHRYAFLQHLAKQPMAEGECFEYTARVDESFDAFNVCRRQFDAVICPNAFVAVAFLQFCEEKAIAVPGDLMVACIKDTRLARFCCPSLTTLAVDFYGIGQQAVVVWQYLRENPEENYRMRIAVLGQVIERESTGLTLPGASASASPSGALDKDYQGGPFYNDPKMQDMMLLEKCFQGCDPLDLRIIGMLTQNVSYEKIAEAVFLGDSTLQYRVRKLFHAVNVKSRREFLSFFKRCMTSSHHLNEKDFSFSNSGLF